MRTIGLFMIGFCLLATSGCAMTFDRGPDLEPFEVSHIDICSVQSTTCSLDNGTVVARHFNVKKITVEVTNTCRKPFLTGVDFRVCQLAGSDPSRLWPSGSSTVDVRYFNDGSTRYVLTAWLDERPLGLDDIIVEVRAAGQWADVIFKAENPICYVAYKQTPRRLYEQKYASWSPLWGRRYQDRDGLRRVPVIRAEVRG